MNNIPTAEELLTDILQTCKLDMDAEELKEIEPDTYNYLIEQINNRTKLQVKAALEQAAKLGTIDAHYETYEEDGSNYEATYKQPFEVDGGICVVINKDSILNAYPLDTIK
jgi:hypothetical protein